MGILYVTEYADWDAESPKEPAINNQTVTFSASVACASAFMSQTRLVRIHTDTICHITFAASPTATTSHRRLPADATEYFAVESGMKVAAILGT